MSRLTLTLKNNHQEFYEDDAYLIYTFLMKDFEELYPDMILEHSFDDKCRIEIVYKENLSKKGFLRRLRGVKNKLNIGLSQKTLNSYDF